MIRKRTAVPVWLLRLGVVAAVLAVLPTGCTDPLNVTDPDIVTPDNLNDKAALPTIRAAAIGDFTLAYSGSGASGSGGVEGVIMTSGLLGDELVNSETFPTRIEVDARAIQVSNATMQDIFRNLSRARRSAEFAASRYRTLAPDTTKETGFPEALALAGFTYVFFAENYCSGVPFSTVNDDGTLSFGPPLTAAQILDTAVARFNAALNAANALPASNTKTQLISLARVGKARALVDKDTAQFAIADTVVASVATGFSYLVQHDENTTRQNNGVFVADVIARRYAVADREGNYTPGATVPDTGAGPGLAWRKVKDLRTPFERVGTRKGFDGITPQWDQLRYGDRKASVTVATGVEARLIQAEAALRRGDTTGNASGFLTRLNDPRTGPPSYFNTNRLTVPSPFVLALPSLGALTTDSTAAAGGAVNLLFNERARWLWLTAHRLSDMRRLLRQYGRSVNSVFPNGTYFKQNRIYGPDVNFPVPVDELNNPNFVQCIDRLP